MSEDYQDLIRLYDRLSRITMWIKRLSGPGEISYTMHKVLKIPPESTGRYPGNEKPEFINDLVMEKSGFRENLHVLDAGCGFGGTIFRWLQYHRGHFDGYTLSGYQKKIAEKEARRRKVENYCWFFERSIEDRPEGNYDIILAIESLVHVQNLSETLSNFAVSLLPGGRILIVDDVAVSGDSLTNKYAGMLMENWFLTRIWTRDDYLAGFKKAELKIREETDLTGLVNLLSAHRLQRKIRNLELLIRFIPESMLRGFLMAHLGGYALQQLYHDRRMKYIMWSLESSR